MLNVGDGTNFPTVSTAHAAWRRLAAFATLAIATASRFAAVVSGVFTIGIRRRKWCRVAVFRFRLGFRRSFSPQLIAQLSCISFLLEFVSNLFYLLYSLSGLIGRQFFCRCCVAQHTKKHKHTDAFTHRQIITKTLHALWLIERRIYIWIENIKEKHTQTITTNEVKHAMWYQQSKIKINVRKHVYLNTFYYWIIWQHSSKICAY